MLRGGVAGLTFSPTAPVGVFEINCSYDFSITGNISEVAGCRILKAV